MNPDPLLEGVAFEVGETAYRWSEVILAAALWGEWTPIVERARAGLVAIEREAGAETPLVPEAEIETAADEFRYERNLVSADDAEAWLALWGLSAEEWFNWIWADLLQRRMLEQDPRAFAGATIDEGEDEEELELAIRCEAICSGALLRLGRQLAARAAIGQKLLEEDETIAGVPVEIGEDPDAPNVRAESLIPGFPVADLARRIRSLRRLDENYDRFRNQVVTPESVAARIRSQQADWMRVSCRMLLCGSEDVARESLVSITEDGAEMDEVALDATAEIRQGTFYMEELEADLRDRLMPAQTGELVGPVRTGGRWAVVRVLGKILATPEDEEIRLRAELNLIEGAVKREYDNRVDWRWGT